MDFNKNLKKFQSYLKDNDIDYAIVFSNDEFLKECADLNSNSRYLLSGFTGSAGDMLVSGESAYLFVDGRYHIQVDEQTDSKFITPVKLKMGETRNEKIKEIIGKSEIKNPKILLNSKKISAKNFEVLKNQLKHLSSKFRLQDDDIVCKFFATNDVKKVYEVRHVGIKQVGRTTLQKLKGLKKYENDILLVFSNDEICYLANIRSNQNLYSSSLSSFALVSRFGMRIFCDLKQIPNEIKNNIEGVVFSDFSDFENEVKKVKSSVYYNSSSTPLYYVEKLQKTGINLCKVNNSPVAKMKAVKNKMELAYIKECYYKSDVAILNSIKYLNEKISKKETVTCKDFMQKLMDFQYEQGVVGLSFSPIFALNERSAIIHCTEYNPTETIKDGDLILLDFGVYFEGGYATDVTRTFAVGKTYKNETLKQVYTTVLKAFLNVLNYPLKKETTYFDLDKKARDVIKRAKFKDFNFNHGTGHGIGLNVHEMPPVLSPSKLAKKKIQANMVFSIEPGMYKEEVGGVRLENSVCTEKTFKGIKIQSLTNLPFDEKMIIFGMLTQKELNWLKIYQDNALK